MRARQIPTFLQLVLAGVITIAPALGDTDDSAAAAAPADEAAGSGAPGSSKSSGNYFEKDPSAWKVTIYPIYGWMPVFGASVNLPDLPSIPGRPGESGGSGTASGSFNGAGFAGFDIEKSRWEAKGSFLFASVSGDKTNTNLNLKTHVGLRVIFGELFGGREVLKGLFLEGGVRRMSVKISASLNDRPEVSRTPGVWDPLIGFTWKHPWKKKWQLTAHFDGGGFGVGTDYSLSGTVRADWRFTRHFGTTFGLGALRFKITNTFLYNSQFERTLTAQQTLWGPLFGFGIYF